METYESATEQNQVKITQSYEFEVEADRLCSFAEDFRRQRNKIRGIWFGNRFTGQSPLRRQLLDIDDTELRDSIERIYWSTEGVLYGLWKGLPAIKGVVTSEGLTSYVQEINCYSFLNTKTAEDIPKIEKVIDRIMDTKTKDALQDFIHEVKNDLNHSKNFWNEFADLVRKHRPGSNPIKPIQLPYTPSADFTSITYHDETPPLIFTNTQATVIREIDNNAQNGNGWVTKKYILMKATAGTSWGQIFRQKKSEINRFVETRGRQISVRMK